MKKAKQNENHLNQTAHQRALKSPEVQSALNALRTRWSDLSPMRRGQELNALTGLGCSRRGIAEELGESESNIRRYIAKAKPTEETNDWATLINTLAHQPKKQSTKSPSEDVRRIRSETSTPKRAEPIINETYPLQDHTRTSTDDQAKKIAYLSSTAVKDAPVVNSATSGQENQAGEDTTGRGYADPIQRALQIRQDKIFRLMSIPDQMKPRPIYNAHSLQRQGKPLPPKDRH